MTLPRQILTDCRRLLSVRGEANSPALAASIVARLETLSDGDRARFFDRLASDFSPDPKAVLAAAQAYASAPQAETMIRLAQVAEPPR
jgi:malonyl-CoA decarboxylase